MARRVENIEDVLVETGVAGLRLISGGGDFLGAANINYQQKLRILTRVRALDVDVVLIDLGAGTSFNTLDFFLASDLGLLMVVPEPTSVENGYRFIRARCSGGAGGSGVTERVKGSWTPRGLAQRGRHPHPLDLLPRRGRGSVRASASGPGWRLRPRFIVNQVREPADVAAGHHGHACARHWACGPATPDSWTTDETAGAASASAGSSWRALVAAAERVRQVARMLLHRAR